MDPGSLVMLIVAGTPTLVAWIHLWLRRAQFRSKLVWTLPIAVPLLGPILYAALFSGVPSEQREDMRAQENSDAMASTSPGDVGHP